VATDFAYLMVKVGANIAGLQSGLNNARGAVSQFGQSGKKTMDGWVAQNGAMVKATGRNMMLMGTAITAFTGLAIRSFAEMEESMASISTMLDEQTMHLLPEYEEGIRNMAEESGDNLKSLTKGMYDLLSAMIEPTEALGVLEIASKTATAGLSSTATAVDGMTTILNSYGLEASQAGDVADWFFTIIKRGKTTFDELAPSIGKVAPIASSAGVSLEEMGAMMALLTRNGVNTDIAITSLKAVITAFGSAGGEASDVAKELGFEMSASALAENGLAWAMEQVNKASSDQMAVLVGNVRAKLATSVVTQNMTELEEDLMAMTNRSGNMMVAYGKTSVTLKKDMERLGQTFKNVKDEAIARIIPEFQELVVGTKEALQNFREWSRENEELSTTIMKIVTAGGPMLLFFGIFLTQLPALVSGVALAVGGLSSFVAFMTGPWGIVMATAVIAIHKVTKAWVEASIAEAKASQARRDNANQSEDAMDIMIASLEELKTTHSDLTDEEVKAISSRQRWIKGIQDTIVVLKEDGEVTDADAKAIFEWTTKQNLASQELIKSINNRKHKTSVVKESTSAVDDETSALAEAIAKMSEESDKIKELKEQYKALNTQLKEGKVSKEEYSEKMRGLIDVFSGIEGGAQKVLDIMGEIDESDPEIAIKFEIFGMEQYESTQLRIKKINQEIVLEKLQGDERQIQSAKFELENFLFFIDTKIEAEKIKNAEILKDLETNLKAQTELQLNRLKISKDITQEEYDFEVKRLKDKFEIDTKIIDETQKKNFDAYNQEKEAFREKTDVILKKLEEKQRKSKEVGDEAVRNIDREGKAVDALGNEYGDLNKEASVKRGSQLGTVTKATMSSWGDTLNSLIKQSPFGSSISSSSSRTAPAMYTSTPRPTLRSSNQPSQISSVAGADSSSAVEQIQTRRPTYSVKPTLRSAQGGTSFVPSTGEYVLHKGEKVTPSGQNMRDKDTNSGGVTILNIFKEEMIPEIMAKYPGAIINTISSDIANHGVTKKVIMGVIRNA